MKRRLIVLLIFLVLLTGTTYILIPGTLNISQVTTIECAKAAGDRFLLDENKWKNWWPHQLPVKADFSTVPGRLFRFNGYSYQITGLFSDKVEVLTHQAKDTINTAIKILPLNRKAIALRWECSLITSLNPFKRFVQYRKAVTIKNNMAAIFLSLQSFLEKTSNIYGFDIREIISKDSTLVATRYLSTGYPGTDQIYHLLDTLRKYIRIQGAVATNYPMLRVTMLNDSSFQTMVALPTNKPLQGHGPIFFQHFVPWKTLTGAVKGGVKTIDQGFRQMEIFVNDNQRTSMAVPFQQIITDRTSEPDSSKWVTIICQPVS